MKAVFFGQRSTNWLCDPSAVSKHLDLFTYFTGFHHFKFRNALAASASAHQFKLKFQ